VPLLVALAGAAEAASVVDSVREALATNPQVEQVRAQRRTADEELRGARAGLRPSIDVRATLGPEYLNTPSTRDRGSGSTDSAERIQATTRLTLSQRLFDGFETRSRVDRQLARVDSLAYRVREVTDLLAADAVEAHLEVMRNRALVELNERNVEEHRRILGQVRDLERAQVVGIADVRQAEARLATAEDNLAAARGNLANAFVAYERIVGAPPGALTAEAPPVAAVPGSAEEAARAASVESPSVRAAAAAVDAVAADLRGSRSGFFPRLDLELSADAGSDTNGQTGSSTQAAALLVMRYNLYRGGGDVAREREALSRMNEARATLAQARRLAEEDAKVSYNAWRTAIARSAANRDRAEAQRLTRDAYLAEFEIGRRQLLDVLDAENELFLARTSLVTAEFTERFAVYRILAALGSLLDTLEIVVLRDEGTPDRSAARARTPERIGEEGRFLAGGAAAGPTRGAPAAASAAPGLPARRPTGLR
jgi:adhesin transport system outer membrane protein